MTSEAKPCLRVVVCGGGNGAHVFTALVASRANTEVSVVTIFEDEAARWNENMQDEMTLSFPGQSTFVKARPTLVTKDPSEVVPVADVIVIVVPSYAHESILRAILPHCRPNSFIVGLPAHPGLDFQFTHIFGQKAKQCTLAVFETLPWACRISEYGRQAQVLGTKEIVGMALLRGEESNVPFDCLSTLQSLMGDKPKIKVVQNCLVVNLMAKTMIHPPLMYGRWKDWDGTPVSEKPLFYQGMDDKQAEILSKVSDEVLSTSKKIKAISGNLDISPVTHISDWINEYYSGQVEDSSSLKRAFQTNKAYNGLVHPMKPADGGIGYVPDFSYRYIREDVPFGLVVLKGIAQTVEIPTPAMDSVIEWAQKRLGQQFLVGKELKGSDVSLTRAPQAYGIYTLDDLLRSKAPE